MTSKAMLYAKNAHQFRCLYNSEFEMATWTAENLGLPGGGKFGVSARVLGVVSIFISDTVMARGAVADDQDHTNAYPWRELQMWECGID